jgi:NhaP-type Na+/H+ or K+/H+ antiporter
MSMTGFSGSDDLLACFVAGNAFSWDDWFRQETEEAHFQDVIDMMLNLAVFVYIGCIIVSTILKLLIIYYRSTATFWDRELI